MGNLKKLAVILTDSPVKPSGGLGIRFQKLIPYLEAAFDVVIFCNGAGGEVSKTKCIPLPESPGCGYSYPLFWSEQIFEHCNFTPDIVLCADHASIIPAKNLARAHKAKFVVEFDLAYFSYKKCFNEDGLKNTEYETLSKVIQMVEKIGIEQSDLVITCSEYYKKELPLGYKQAVAVQNGIELFDFANPALERYAFQGGHRQNYVFIGRLNTQKGVSLLTELKDKRATRGAYTVRQLPEQYAKLPDGVALHFVGGPVASDQYNSVLESCKMNKSKFHIPFVSGVDKARIIRSADAIVFPSVHEPFGIVGLEAFAACTPLITTGQGGISDYADHENAIIVDGTAQGIEIGFKILESLTHPEMSTMLSNALETAHAFSWKNAAGKMIDALENRL